MKNYFFYVLCIVTMPISAQLKKQNVLMDKQIISISKVSLQDKIKGGWAGQTIGVTYGGPYEFHYLGTLINDYQKISWPNGQVKRYFDLEPGLYDDIYMDLSFVDVIEKYGVDAPVDSFANAFANAAYPLWHANQTGRYNILNGMKAPASGYWKNNPHADDIDFQIESDFAGLMHPGMGNSASKLCDKVGHIMNYGEGYYGGVYVANMYSLAFVSNDINFVVTEALKSIPEKSKYRLCMQDVINWHKQYPNDWKKSWFEIQRKWTEDIACPEGVFMPFDISARVNSAYVLMGLLYGQGDFGKTVEIATRCGQDADCNPSTAGGILGAMLGFEKIPDYWKNNLKEVADRNFVYTNISLNRMYELGFKHASQMLQRNGGTVNGDKITIIYQQPKPVPFEESFAGLHPLKRKWLGWNSDEVKDSYEFDFEGNGLTIQSGMSNEWATTTSYVFKVEIDIDEKKEILNLPYNFRLRRNELYSNFDLQEGKHTVKIKILNPDKIASLQLKDLIMYSNK
ncbi:MAG: ADP-ribosylglycohydrolase family protein [Bacteroidota bacterium]